MPLRRLALATAATLLCACGGSSSPKSAAVAVPTGQTTDANQAATAGVSTLPSGCSAATAVSATQVAIKNTAFVEACIKVSKGSVVTFTNEDSISHTVTADSGSVDTFDSGNLAASATFSHTFSTAGGIGIHCTYHPDMLMGVLVE